MHLVLEGGDGAGKSSQSRLLAEWCGAQWRCFPDRSTSIGKLIDGHLKRTWRLAVGRPEISRAEELQMDALAFQALQLANRAEVLPDILDTLRKGRSVVCDRYWQSGYVYGVTDGLDPEYLLHIHRFLPEPHLNILLDLPPDVAEARMVGRSGRERYEGDAKFSARIAEAYRTLWRTRSEDPRWVVVNAEGSREETQLRLRAVVEQAQKHTVVSYEREDSDGDGGAGLP